jgi:glucosamine kinase
LVIEAANKSDPVAKTIVQAGADYISLLAHKLLAANPPRLSLIGGLAPMLVPWLDPLVRQRLAPALEQPEMGAVRLAMQTWPANGAH